MPAAAAIDEEYIHQLLQRLEGVPVAAMEATALGNQERALQLFCAAYTHGVTLASRVREAKEAEATYREVEATGGHASRTLGTAGTLGGHPLPKQAGAPPPEAGSPLCPRGMPGDCGGV